jgi:hypothetical protein
MNLNCISVHQVNFEMKLLKSDLVGYKLYRLYPMELGYEPKVLYISNDKQRYWLYGKPMEGKQIEKSNISYFKTN